MTKIEFITLANKMRLANKYNWVTLLEIVDGKAVIYKAYGTWIQILRIDGGPRSSSAMELNVREYKQFLNESLAV
tara:strand:+ start:511 stop:735 length:225 start_codon:yes stop_codon:yes gene_type:complete